MIDRMGRTRIFAITLLLTLLLAACTTMNDALLPAALTPSSSVLQLEAEVGSTAGGSFSFTSDVRTRYTVAVTGGSEWLSLTSGQKGNIKPGQSKTVTVEGFCGSAGTFPDGEVTVEERSGSSAVVSVVLECTDPGDPGDPGDPPPPPPPAGGFEITLVFSGSISEAQKDVFRSAAARWAELIVGDVTDTPFSKPANACGAGEPSFSGVVDDVVIYASVEPIDGSGNVLGSAGPCYIRSGSALPLYGVMRFDSADVGSLGNNFEDVILHEMGHVIGIGTLWDYLGLLSYNGSSCQNSNDPEFTGSDAVSEWQALGGAGFVPVENSGGSGTKCGHWEETVFANELMTGYLNSGVANPISRTTVASLDDLGYLVDLAAADPYTLPGSNLALQGDRFELIEEVLTPIGVVGEDGAILGAD